MKRRVSVAVAIAVMLALPSVAVAAPGAHRLPGLKQPVKVVRDGQGVPHAYARSEHDAYFMVGYLHAQDRLFQMDQSRRQASETREAILVDRA